MSGELHAVHAESDLSLLARIHAASFDEAWSEAALRGLLKTPGTLAFAAPDGFIIMRLASDEAEILSLAVAPGRRRRGWGAALVSKAATLAHRSGARTMFLEVATSNEPARALYRRLGFAEAGRRRAYYGGKEDALILSANLPLMPLGNPKASTTVATQPRGNDRDAD